MAWERLRYGDPEEADLVAKTERQFVGAAAKRLDPQQLDTATAKACLAKPTRSLASQPTWSCQMAVALRVWSGL